MKKKSDIFNQKETKTPMTHRTAGGVAREAARLGIYDLDILQGVLKVFYDCGWESARKALIAAKEQTKP